MKRVYFLCALYAGVGFGCRQADHANKLANVDQSVAQNGAFYSKKAIVAAMLESSQTDQSKFKTLSKDGSRQVPILIEREPEDVSRVVPIAEMLAGGFARIVYDLDESKGVFELTQSEQQDIDLRQWDTPVKNQGKEGLCTAFATAAAMENLAKQKGQEFDLSERHLWSLYKYGSVSMSTQAASETSIVSEQTWPYSSNAPASNAPGVLKISRKGLTTSLKDLIAMVQNNKPVVWGGNVPLFDPQSGIVTGYSKDYAHALAIVGVQFDKKITGGGYFILKNSWGPSSGDKGYIYLPFNFCSHDMLCLAWPLLDVETGGGTSSTSNRDLLGKQCDDAQNACKGGETNACKFFEDSCKASSQP